MENKEILLQGAKEFGLNLSEAQLGQFLTFKELLLKWNEKMNLTAITEEKEIMVKHFLDSISSSVHFDFSKPMKLIDVGTGAGFPGVPLKIVHPSLEVTLLDSLNKRLNFLHTVIEDLGLKQVTTVHSRAEDAGSNSVHREQYDICVSRAVAHMAVLLEYCLPFIQVGGYFIAQKGPAIVEELKESAKALEQLGGEIVGVEEVKIPFSDLEHAIVIIKKIKSTPTKYPRKAGTPSKSPLK